MATSPTVAPKRQPRSSASPAGTTAPSQSSTGPRANDAPQGHPDATTGAKPRKAAQRPQAPAAEATQRWASRIVDQADVDPRTLIPNPQNWRKHPHAQQVALDATLDEIGWIQRVIVNRTTGHMIDGHLRVERALAKHEKHVPVSYVELSSEEEQIALATFDPLGALATTDSKILDALRRNIECMNEDLAQFLRPTDADALLGGNGKDEDEIPAMPVNIITRHGDIWQLGEHRLLCGDCRDADDMKKLMGGKRINVAVTSPPYAAQRDYDKSSGFKPIFPEQYVEWFAMVQEHIADYLTDDGSFFLNIKEHCDGGQRSLYVKDLTLAHVRQWGWRLVDELIWIHGGTPKAVINRFKNAWEPIFHFTRIERHKFRPERVRHGSDNIPDWGGGHPCDEDNQGVDNKFHTKKRLTAAQRQAGSANIANIANMQGDSSNSKLMSAVIGESMADAGGMAYPSNVLSLGKNKEALGHSAAFPVGLPEFFIMAFSDVGDIVFDPFMGSGTTLIAAEKHRRMAYGTELSPVYCDIIVQRWETFTGKAAVRVKR